MTQEIPFSVIPMSIVQIVCGFALPAVVTLLLRRRFGGGMKAFWTGCLVFVIAAGILESMVHQLVLGLSPAGPVILGNAWLYALYGGAMAALFEEGGRYLAFRRVLRWEQADNGNALMYGAGHGGAEAFALLVISRSGRSEVLTAGLDAETAQATLEQLVRTFRDTAWWMYLLAVVERALAMALQLSMSVLVWFAAKDGARGRKLLFLSIGIHFAVDFTAALLSQYLPAAAVELVLAVLTAGVVLAARAVWRKYSAPGSAKDP